MIVLSGALVLVALVLLVFGALDRNLPYVYASIGVSVLSLLLLLVGILQRRGQLPEGEGSDAAAVPVTEGTAERPLAVVGARQGDTADAAPASTSRRVRPVPAPDADLDARRDEQRDLHGEHDAEDDDEHDDDEYDEEQDAEDAYDERLEDEGFEDEQGPVDDELADDLGEDGDELADDPDEDGDDQGEPTSSGVTLPGSRRQTVLVVAGRARYHRAGCRYLYGKQSASRERAEARAEGFAACGVCKPDMAETSAAPDVPAESHAPEPVEDDRYETQPVDRQEHEEPSPPEGSSQEGSPQELSSQQGSAQEAAEQEPPSQDEAPGSSVTSFEEAVFGGPVFRDDPRGDEPADAAVDHGQTRPSSARGLPSRPVQPVLPDVVRPDAEPAGAAAPDMTGSADTPAPENAEGQAAVDLVELGVVQGGATALPAQDDEPGPDAEAPDATSVVQDQRSDTPERDSTTSDTRALDIDAVGTPIADREAANTATDEGVPSEDDVAEKQPIRELPDGGPEDDEQDISLGTVPAAAGQSRGPGPDVAAGPGEAGDAGAGDAATGDVATRDTAADRTAAVADAPSGDARTGGAAVVGAAAGADAVAAKAPRANKGSGGRVPVAKATKPKASSVAKEPTAKAPPAKKAAAKKPPAAKAPAAKAPAAKATGVKGPASGTKTPAAETAAVRKPTVRTVRPDALRLSSPAAGRTSTTRVSARGAAPRPAAPRPASAPLSARPGQVVVVPDRDRFHRPDCRFVRDVAGATALPKPSAARQGYIACGVCKP